MVVMGEEYRVLGRCDRCQEVGGIRKVCQLMERCDGHVGGVKCVENSDTCQYVEGLFDSNYEIYTCLSASFY